MATSGDRNKNLNRPRKGRADHERRVRQHRKRLVALGMPEDAVAVLNSAQLRALLRHPKAVSARYAAT